MDVFNYVIHKTEWLSDIDNIPEMTRRAFVNLFQSDSEDARLVAKFIVDRCRWSDMTETNSGIIEAKQNTGRNIVIGLIDQLNKEPIEQIDINEEE
jgi:hypothetical protein